MQGDTAAVQKRSTRRHSSGGNPWWKVPPPASPPNPTAAQQSQPEPFLPPPTSPPPPESPLVSAGPAEAAKARAAAAQTALFREPQPLLPPEQPPVSTGPAEAAKARAAAAQAALFPEVSPLPPPDVPQSSLSKILPVSAGPAEAAKARAAAAQAAVLPDQQAPADGALLHTRPAAVGAHAAQPKLPSAATDGFEARQRSGLRANSAGGAFAAAAAVAAADAGGIEDGQAGKEENERREVKAPVARSRLQREMASLLQHGSPVCASPHLTSDVQSSRRGATDGGAAINGRSGGDGGTADRGGASKGCKSPPAPKARMSRELAALLQHHSSATHASTAAPPAADGPALKSASLPANGSSHGSGNHGSSLPFHQQRQAGARDSRERDSPVDAAAADLASGPTDSEQGGEQKVKGRFRRELAALQQSGSAFEDPPEAR